MIVIASTVVYGRALVEIAAVARPLPAVAAPPILVLAAALPPARPSCGRARAGSAPPRGGRPAARGPEDRVHPAALTSRCCWRSALANERLARALYAESVISGLTDVTRSTLSVSRLVASSQIGPATAGADRGGRAVEPRVQGRDGRAGLGDARLRRFVALAFGLQLLIGGGLLAFWGEAQVDLEATGPAAS